MTSGELAELLWAAYHSEFGIAVETPDPEFLRQKLYPIRKQFSELLCLSLVISPLRPAVELWLVKEPEDASHD